MFAPRITVASPSGESDVVRADVAAPRIGVAFLDSAALSKPAQAAVRDLAARGRSESLVDDPVGFVAVQLDSLDGLGGESRFVAVNIRATSPDPTRAVVAIYTDRGVGVEMSAHCRWDELCTVGYDRTLLRGSDRLAAYVVAAAESGVSVGARARAETDGVDHSNLAATPADAGVDWSHVDTMDPEAVVTDVTAVMPDPFLVANNGVRGRETATEYLDYEADVVSTGRLDSDPRVFRRVRTVVDNWFTDREDAAKPDDESEVSA